MDNLPEASSCAGKSPASWVRRQGAWVQPSAGRPSAGTPRTPNPGCFLVCEEGECLVRPQGKRGSCLSWGQGPMHLGRLGEKGGLAGVGLGWKRRYSRPGRGCGSGIGGGSCSCGQPAAAHVPSPTPARRTGAAGDGGREGRGRLRPQLRTGPAPSPDHTLSHTHGSGRSQSQPRAVHHSPNPAFLSLFTASANPSAPGRHCDPRRGVTFFL